MVHFNNDSGFGDLRLENRTTHEIKYTQKGETENLKLPPGKNVLYNRCDPMVCRCDLRESESLTLSGARGTVLDRCRGWGAGVDSAIP